MLVNPFNDSVSSSGRAVIFSAAELTYLSNTTANITPSFPASSATGFVSYWYFGITQVADINTIVALNGPDGKSVLWIGHQTIDNNLVLHISLSSDDFTSWIDFTGSTTLPMGNVWHNVMIGWDLTGPTINYNVDGLPGSWSTTISNTSFAITYTGKTLQVGANEPINGQSYLSGSIAEFFFIADQNVDVTDTAIISNFVDSATDTNKYACYLAINGAAPLEMIPHVYLTGDPNWFNANLTDYDEFPWALEIDLTRQNTFTLNGGPMHFAQSDPFQQESTALIS